jgi:hypothetical protein
MSHDTRPYLLSFPSPYLASDLPLHATAFPSPTGIGDVWTCGERVDRSTITGTHAREVS